MAQQQLNLYTENYIVTLLIKEHFFDELIETAS